MKRIVFALPENETLAKNVAQKTNAEIGQIIIRNFPDGESYVRVLSEVSGKEAVLFCTLHHPDAKILSLFFLANLLKDSGAERIILIAPYLAYMRQDMQFNTGESVTSKYFAKLISSFTDEIITIDPHLHRMHSMEEIYSVPCKVIHASALISKWIDENITQPLLIGPDSESEQWVSEVARRANVPFILFEKKRLGDNEVKVFVSQLEKYKQHTPVLIDDIISTAHTMIETSGHLKKAGMKTPVCIGVHAVFAGNAFEELKKSGVKEIITCNTIPHESNKMDVSGMLAAEILNRRYIAFDFMR